MKLNWLYVLLSFTFSLLPNFSVADAPLEADSATPNVQITSAPNGVPMVNIQAPNPKGLSHNKYKHYNVNPQGLILNNATAPVKTQLGGWVSHNPNFTGQSASVILNEVTSTSRTQLKGYTEVGGSAAHVIVANPNGISVNGGGFINTPRATLHTGTPQISNGLPAGFNIQGGDITVEGQGLNVDNIDKVELYAKAVQINADIHAKDITIATGVGQINTNGEFTAATETGTGVSIDASLLGSIYANTITLSANEKGVGVNLPPIVQAQSQLAVTADGKLTFDKTLAGTLVATSNSSDIEFTDRTHAQTAQITAANTLRLKGANVAVSAQNELDLAAHSFVNEGQFLIGVDETIQTKNTNARAAIQATSLQNSGNLQSTGSLNITSGNVINKTDAQLQSDGALILNVNALTQENDATLTALSTLTIQGKTGNNSAANTVNNAGEITAQNIKATANNITNTGKLHSISSLTATANRIDNQAGGEIKAQSLDLSASDMDNLGNIQSTGALTLTVEQLENQTGGTIQAGGHAAINADTINNQANARIVSSQGLTFNAKAGNGLAVANATNAGTIEAQNMEGLFADFINNGKILATQSIDLAIVQQLNNTSNAQIVASDNALNINAATLNNSGLISGNGVRLDAQILNNDGGIHSKQNMTITAHEVTNDQVILSEAELQLLIANQFKNSTTGDIYSQGNLLIAQNSDAGKTQQIDNLGNIQTQADLRIDAVTVNNSGTAPSVDDNRGSTVTKIVSYGADSYDIVSTTVTTQSAPAGQSAKMLANGDITINSDTLNNAHSLIAAGGDVTLTGGTVNNVGTVLITTEEVVTIRYRARRYCKRKDESGDCNRWGTTPEHKGTTTNIREIDRQAYTGTAIVAGGTLKTDLLTLNNAAETTASDGLYRIGSASLETAPSILAGDTANTHVDTSGTDSQSLSTLSNPLPDLPSGKFGRFTLNTDANHPYLIESNPLYADWDTFISSSYLTEQIDVDPDATLRRLGDAAFETHWVAGQVTRLKQQRFLQGFSSDVDQFKGLMDNAIALQDSLQLSYGVSLSAGQIAQLDRPIVWMETRQYLDGDVLVPVVYLASSSAPLNAEPTLRGTTTDIEVASLNNSGDIEADGTLSIKSDNIDQQAGRLISGGDANIETTGDFNNVSAGIQSGGKLTIDVGGEFAAKSHQNTVTDHYARGSETRTLLGAGTEIRSEDSLQMIAKNDVSLSGTNVNTASSATLQSQQGNINLDSEATQRHYSFNTKSGYDRGSETLQRGSQITAGNDIELSAAQGDVSLIGSHLTANDQINLRANELLLASAQETRHQQGKSTARARSLFGSTKRTEETDIRSTTQKMSVLNSNNISITSQGDTKVAGAHLLGSEDVNIQAGQDIDIQSVEQVYVDNSKTKVSRSGFISDGGAKFTIGNRKQTEIARQTNITQISSTLGSLIGDVNLNAGNDITIKGTDLLASEGDVNITGDNVNLIASNNQLSRDEIQKIEQSGLTYALSGGLIDDIQTVKQSIQRYEETDNDTLKQLHAWRVGRTLVDSANKVNKLSESAEGQDKTDIEFSVSMGSSKSETRREIRSTNALGSSVVAQGNINITARGDENRIGSGDINTQGTRIEGENVTLNAANNLNLKSAQNTYTDDTESDSSSNGIGVSISTSNGANVFVEASLAQGAINQSNDQYLETLITAKNKAQLNSGNDTQLKGTQVKADQITANVGGDLLITSQQDESHYKNRQTSISGKVSVGVTQSGAVSGSLSASQLKADSTYQSVQQQSGLFAGEQGYDITVGNNTQLTGGVIVSDAQADKNHLSTDTLNVASINNQAHYDIESISVSISSSGGPSGIGGGFSQDAEKNSNTTYSALSQGTLDVRAHPEYEIDPTLKSNATEAHQILAQNFDAQKVQEVQEQTEITQMFAQESFRVVGDLYEKQEALAAEIEQKKSNNAPQQEIDQLEQQLEAEKAMLPDKAIAHALAGGITATLGGTEFIQGAAASGLAEASLTQLEGQLPSNALLKNLVASAIGATASGTQGALIAGNADLFNRQLHPNEFAFIDKVKEDYAKERGISIEQATKELTRAALYDADTVAKESYTDYTTDQLDTYQQANHYLQNAAARQGLTFLNEQGQQQAAFTSTETQRTNLGLFINQAFEQPNYKEIIKLKSEEKGLFANVTEKAREQAGSGVGVATGVYGAAAAIVDDVGTLIDPKTYEQLSKDAQAVYELYQKDPEQFNEILGQLPEQTLAGINDRLTQWDNEVTYYDMMGQDFKESEHATSGVVQTGLENMSPTKIVKITDILEAITSKMKAPTSNIHSEMGGVEKGEGTDSQPSVASLEEATKAESNNVKIKTGEVDKKPGSGFEGVGEIPSFNSIYAKAPEAKLEIDSIADDIVGSLGGSVAKAPIKSQDRAIQKIINDYDGDASQIKDFARNTIIVDANKVDSVASLLSNQGAKVKVIDANIDPLGYSGINTSIKTKSGLTGEIQVNTPEMIYAKEPESIAKKLLGDNLYNDIASKTNVKGGQGHKLYEEWRVIDDKSSEAAKAIAEESRAFYNSIREAYAKQ